LTLAELEHWELFGGTCHVAEMGDERAVVELRACTGELVECRQSDDPALIDRLRARRECDVPPDTDRDRTLTTSSSPTSRPALEDTR
jgi:hypothetical protein